MLDLYTFTTPNGRKIPIALAELALPYELHLVDLKKDEQHAPSYLAISPNGKIPALVDRDGPGGERVTIFESGAILTYLADKTGKLLPRVGAARYDVLAWLFWQVGGVGPMFGQLGAFSRETPRNEPAYAKFLKEAKRLTGVLDGRLAGREWIAGDYSIADIATYPWVKAIADMVPEVTEASKDVQAWMKRMEGRPAVAKGMRLET